MAEYNSKENFDQLVEKGDIIQCPSCGEYNAYAWEDVNMDCNSGLRIKPDDGFSDGGEAYTDEECLTNWPDVYHIPSSSCWEWECGNCKAHLVEANSPILAECYTHIPPGWDEFDDEE